MHDTISLKKLRRINGFIYFKMTQKEDDRDVTATANKSIWHNDSSESSDLFEKYHINSEN